MKKVVKIGSGAGFSDDRILPAKDLAERGDINYLVFECLSERTVALAQLEKLHDPLQGYNEYLEDRFEAVLPACSRRGIKIITSMGAANPPAAGKKIIEIAQRLNIKGLKVAVVTGDDVTQLVQNNDDMILELDNSISNITKQIVSANAYIGSEPVVEALREGADIVITGRIADPSLFLAPLIYEFNWKTNDWAMLGKGVLVGHLLECSSQVSGGYFIDPGVKDVPDPANIGFPIAEVEDDGSFVVTKIPGTGGQVCRKTCIEQALYEIHDPALYITADCVADFSQVEFIEEGLDRVRVIGASGTAKTDSYKVSVGYVDSYIGEGQISYCGPNALARGELALDMVRQRLKDSKLETEEIRFEIIGVNSTLRGASVEQAPEPAEIRIRVAARTKSLRDARKIGHEVSALWLNGPAGGGGATKIANEVVAIRSTLVKRSEVKTEINYHEA
ncbi:acyclic terpene utilization AtuA family protein [Dongshaea marina]|uniref:acyclic terpene utilization AtuA family protein n=1 Tax=Dongshaea marina TaxID=2047966 RepID=UPI000D3EC6BE|nr:acyclic terpene utilization AtuA family protein [Dongshaea marina]